MIQRYTCRITLVVLGPFLTAATGPDRYGVDKSAHRDFNDNLVIPASHLKGKLRSALEELNPFFEDANRPDLKALFGTPSAEGSYEPIPAALHFTDLVTSVANHGDTRTRVTINRVSQTAGQNLLREVEAPFASGSEISFSGEVTFSAPDLVVATRLENVLRVGLRWLGTVGAEKGVGFGRIKSAQVGTPTPITVSITAKSIGISATPGSLHLCITAQEPLLVGGIKSRRTNYIMSRQELAGGLLKGALARALNEAHGIRPVTLPLNESCMADFPTFKALVKHFSKIRVTHAWPALAGDPRPVRLPLSTVEHNGTLAGDLALSDERAPMVQKRFSPAYLGDAKNLKLYEGFADPVELFITRSEIDDVSQRTAKGQLFTYQLYAPYTFVETSEGKQKNPIEWICNVDFAAITDLAEQGAARQQFALAVKQHLHRLGKLSRAVTVAVGDGRAAPAATSHAHIQDGLALITLQSNAIMLDPKTVRSLPLGQDLHESYATYWHDISGGALTLEDFFAHQGFEGGYLYHRYLGAAERSNYPNRYRPYYLTLAGSLFKLRVVDEERATRLLTRWLAGGLSLPQWALAEYGQYKRALWETCPFVPENGYGEIAVNLDWHWEKRI